MASAATSYIRPRAESLAVMHLTRRDDLIVSTQMADCGVDLLVTLCKDGRATGRVFGVRVLGAVSSGRASRNGGPAGPRLVEGEASWAKSIPFPVCIFFFTMDDDQGYFKWLKEPTVRPDGTPALRLNEGGDLTALTDEKLSGVVERLNYWYDRQAVSVRQR